ncbi:hypothetical protein L596_020649 [Steinernema carpocapsae]|uniref:Uncharacterized protein n=1 Tax=Steinernema carpocapsae TaxID=34508 RepID=A0A4U5MU71_STECR|nr:hypothetical protein L596_020649 [Steinernema carpocapsae]
MFPSPPLFSSIHSGLWFLDPYDVIDYEGRDHELYSNWALLANNVTLVIALPVLYSALVLSIKFSQTTSGTNKHHMQCGFVCLHAHMADSHVFEYRVLVRLVEKQRYVFSKGQRSDLLDLQQGHSKSRSSVLALAQQNYARHFYGVQVMTP